MNPKRIPKRGTFPCPAVIRTDQSVFVGHGTLADQFDGDPVGLQAVIDGAQARGYNPSPNDVYLPTLADDIGDPLAFVPPTGGRSHIKKVCEMRNEECQGLVNVKRTQRDPPIQTSPPLAEDIIQEGVAAEIARDPSLDGKREQVREEFIERHAPQP